MKMIVLLIIILVYFFMLSVTLTAMAADPLIQDLSVLQGNLSFDIDENTTGVNVSAIPQKNTASAGGMLNMVSRMFTFRIPTTLVPNFLGDIISFINWILILLLGVAAYRLASPATGG